jgi:hypothetical protein
MNGDDGGCVNEGELYNGAERCEGGVLGMAEVVLGKNFR